MLLLHYTYHTAISVPSPLSPILVCCPTIDRGRYVILQSTNCITNIFAVHGFYIYIVSVARRKPKECTFLPLRGVQSKMGLPLSRLAQSSQRSDVRFAFLYNIGVYDRRAELEFVLENPWRHDMTQDRDTISTIYVAGGC
jgi:hypothetical protein